MTKTHYEIIRARQRRLTAAGLCPICGKVAAPYERCLACRQKRSMGRYMEKLASIGFLVRHKVTWMEGGRGRRVGVIVYRLGERRDVTAPYRFSERPPRMGGAAVDTEAMVLEIVRNAGANGASDEEILAEIGRRRLAARAA